MEAVMVTPAHHFPTGAVLTRERRTQLLEWAERNDRLILEDDCDTELRFAGAGWGWKDSLGINRVGSTRAEC